MRALVEQEHEHHTEWIASEKDTNGRTARVCPLPRDLWVGTWGRSTVVSRNRGCNYWVLQAPRLGELLASIS